MNITKGSSFVTEWNPPHYSVSSEIAHGTPVHFTMQIRPIESGSRIRIPYGELQAEDKAELEPLFRGAAQDVLDPLDLILEKAER